MRNDTGLNSRDKKERGAKKKKKWVFKGVELAKDLSRCKERGIFERCEFSHSANSPQWIFRKHYCPRSGNSHRNNFGAQCFGKIRKIEKKNKWKAGKTLERKYHIARGRAREGGGDTLAESLMRKTGKIRSGIQKVLRFFVEAFSSDCYCRFIALIVVIGIKKKNVTNFQTADKNILLLYAMFHHSKQNRDIFIVITVAGWLNNPTYRQVLVVARVVTRQFFRFSFFPSSRIPFVTRQIFLSVNHWSFSIGYFHHFSRVIRSGLSAFE